MRLEKYFIDSGALLYIWIRDNSDTAEIEYDSIGKIEKKGLYIDKKFSDPDINKIFSISKTKPKVAILDPGKHIDKLNTIGMSDESIGFKDIEDKHTNQAKLRLVDNEEENYIDPDEE